MSSVGPLLTAQGGERGPFIGWLEGLGLRDFLREYPIATLVAWGWLEPQYRIEFPVSCVEALEKFPEPSNDALEQWKPYSLLWDSEWFIDNDQEDLWFLHPLFRPDDSTGQLLRTQSHTATSSASPTTHYAEYFFHWQGYALIDVIRSATCFPALLVTPNLDSDVAGLKRLIELGSHDPTQVLKIEEKWGGYARPMTWLSHYRAFREAFSMDEMTRGEINRELRHSGALGLAKHLGVTGEMLDDAIRNQLLVLAEDWSWANERGNQWTTHAWHELQRDVRLAVDWLVHLTGKSLDFYLDKWLYTHKGQASWAELHKVLPYEHFEDRQYFLSVAPHYLKAYNAVASDGARLHGDALKSTTDILRETNWPFETFLSAFRQMHSAMSFSSKDMRRIDFRNRRPVDYYSLLALRVESSLRWKLEHEGLLEGAATLNAYIAKLASCRGMSATALREFEGVASKLTRLHNTPRDCIASIIAFNPDLSEYERYLVRAFLCSVLARNYFAHHYYMDDLVLKSDGAEFLFAGILVTTLWLLSIDDQSACQGQ